MSQVELSQRGRGRGLGIALLAGAAVLAARSGRAPDNGGGGPGNGGDSTNMVQVGASLGNVTVSQVRARARQPRSLMRRHLAIKEFGSSIRVEIPFTPQTTLNGGSVTWPYRIETRLGHNTVFGWRTSGDLGFSEDGVHVSNVNGQTGSPATLVIMFTAPNDPDQEWDIRVKLFAAVADSFGNPTAEYTQVAEGEHAGAVRTVQGAEVSLGGSLGTVQVSQGGRRGC